MQQSCGAEPAPTAWSHPTSPTRVVDRYRGTDGGRLLPLARQRAILELLHRQGSVSLGEAARRTGASPATVRRDMHQLALDGLLDRQQGGAVAIPPARPTLHRGPSPRRRQRGEAMIARRAAELIAPGETVLLGAGTATEHLARELANRLDIAVVTNSILVARALATSPGIPLTLTGGTLHEPTSALIGPIAEYSVKDLAVRRIFVSGDGLTARRGLSTGFAAVAGIDRALIGAVGDVVVLADSSIVGRDDLVLTAAIDALALVVTDAGPGTSEVGALRAEGVEVDIVKVTDGALSQVNDG